jgi:DNA-binding GntR family transcriptional regulator
MLANYNGSVPFIRREAMSDAVTKEIRSAILSGSLAPGRRIRQEELAELYQVSRVPIREALRVLEGEGLIRNDRWRGAIVTPLDVNLIRDVYEFRGIVDTHVAKTLASRADFNFDKVRKIITSGRLAAQKHDVGRLVKLDLDFHTSLYDAMGNSVVCDVMRGQWTHIRRIMGGTLTISGYPEQVWDEHSTILEAIEQHNPDLAVLRASEHTRAASLRLIENLEKQLSGSEPQQAVAPKRKSRT